MRRWSWGLVAVINIIPEWYTLAFSVLNVCVCVSVRLCSPNLLNYWSDFNEIWYAFWGLDCCGKIFPQMRAKCSPKWGQNFNFCLYGLYLLKSLSNFAESWYVRFLSNFTLYFVGLNPVGKFPLQWEEGGFQNWKKLILMKFDMLDFWVLELCVF